MDLRMLQRDVTPPPSLKARVLASVRERRVLRPRHRPWRMLAAALAGVALFAAGVMVGRRNAGPAAAPPQYALLLYEDSGFAPAQSEQALVAEYATWAAEWSARGLAISGEKLGPEASLLAGRGGGAVVGVEPRDAVADVGRLAGFFLIGAAGDSAALAVARSCPHLRYGGRIVLRRIEPT
ncbi:MAG: hypothetical protein ACREMV_14305 [Gemmatimonadales bacterium]